jgi:hypothetical protein
VSIQNSEQLRACQLTSIRTIFSERSKLRKLAIFDVNEARVTGYIPLTEDRILFGAGLEKVVVGLPAKGVLERWNLSTLEREASVETAIGMKTLSLGHASNGPVVLNTSFLDLGTFRPMPQSAAFRWGRPVPSADGTAYAEWYTDSAAGGGSALWVVEGNEVKYYRAGELGHILPGPDGKTIFTSRGLANSQLKQTADDVKFGFCIPALRGNLFLSLTSAQVGKGDGGYTVYALGQSAPIIKVPNAEHGMVFNNNPSNADGPWKRVYFIPQANVIVVLPESNDQLVLHKIDVDDALEKSGVDYLLVTSQPPQSVKRGGIFKYPIVVKAKHKEVTFKLDAGPKGMEVARDGIVSWKVPGDAMDGDQEIILTIKDGKGQEIFHTFALRVLK